jgi:hypothetical protein
MSRNHFLDMETRNPSTTSYWREKLWQFVALEIKTDFTFTNIYVALLSIGMGKTTGDECQSRIHLTKV